MKWVGYWMIGVSILHMAVSILFYGETYMAFLNAGVLNAVNSVADGAALWFFMAGAMMLVIGICLLNMDKPPLSVGVLLLLIALLGAALIPKSGAWFLLPPALAIILHRRKA